MKARRSLPQLVLYTSVFAITGFVIGIGSGLIMTPYSKDLILGTAITSLLDGVFLSWFYKSKKITLNLIARIGIGLVIGMFLGSVFGGMLGTILSIPFPDPFISILFLTGTFVGMFISGAGIPIALINIGGK